MLMSYFNIQFNVYLFVVLITTDVLHISLIEFDFEGNIFKHSQKILLLMLLSGVYGKLTKLQHT